MEFVLALMGVYSKLSSLNIIFGISEELYY
jgi:hypothetical protein